jgi:AcrR family transcriptional regulator
MKTDKAVVDETLTSKKILDVARDQVRRFGEAKTNVVDIARALGTSHTTIYRHFRSKADVFDAIVGEAMRDEEELAHTFVDSEGAASERLEGFVLALHKRKLQRFANDPEVYQLYRRVVDERPGLIHDYAARMTRLVATILADGVRKKEYKIDDIDAAAEVVRDAVTVYVHPAHVEAAAKAGHPLEPAIKRMISTLNIAFRSGFSFAPSKRGTKISCDI